MELFNGKVAIFAIFAQLWYLALCNFGPVSSEQMATEMAKTIMVLAISVAICSRKEGLMLHSRHTGFPDLFSSEFIEFNQSMQPWVFGSSADLQIFKLPQMPKSRPPALTLVVTDLSVRTGAPPLTLQGPHASSG